jgi:hypothetical protein
MPIPSEDWMKEIVRGISRTQIRPEAGSNPWKTAAAEQAPLIWKQLKGDLEDAIEEFNQLLPDNVPEVSCTTTPQGELLLEQGRCSLMVKHNAPHPEIVWEREGHSFQPGTKQTAAIWGTSETGWQCGDGRPMVEFILSQFLKDAYRQE